MGNEIDVFEREDDRGHSPFGPSSSNQWIPCTGRHALIEQLKALGKNVNVSSIYAAEGTAAHSVLAQCLINNQDAWEHADELITVENFPPFLVDEVMVSAVQDAIDLVRRKLIQYHEFNPILIVEQRVASPEDEFAFGTADIVILVPGQRIIVIDFKYGKGIVVEPDDEQLRLYGQYAFDTYKTWRNVLAGAEYAIADEAGGLDEEIFPDRNTIAELYIVQPRITFHPKGSIRKHVTDREELSRFWYGEALPALQEGKSGNGKLCLGDHCRYCPVGLNCPELNKGLQQPVPSTEVVEQSDEELGANLDRCRFYAKMLPLLEREGFSRAMNGRKVPGSKLVRKLGDRVWKPTLLVQKDGQPQEVVELEQEMVAEFGHEAYTPTTLLTPAAIEKLGKKGKDFAKKWGQRPETGLTLAPTKDRREEQSPDPLDAVSEADGMTKEEVL